MSDELTAEQKSRIHHLTETAKLIRVFKAHYGEEAYRVAAKHFGEKALAVWKQIGEKSDDRSIEALIQYLWEPLRQEGFEYESIETDTGVQMKCTRCGLYDLAKHYGIEKEIFYHSCETDPYITEGFNPNIGFKRTKTLMQGDDCCDHFYYYKDKNE